MSKELIFEGHMNDSHIYHWGRLFYNNDECIVGYFDSNNNVQLQGNCRKYINGKSSEQGWFESGVYKGDFDKESAYFKYWDEDTCFIKAVETAVEPIEVVVQWDPDQEEKDYSEFVEREHYKQRQHEEI